MDTTITDDADLFGQQTRLAIDNFSGTGRKLSEIPEFLRAYAQVKAAAAAANAELGVLDPSIGSAIEQAACEVVDAKHSTQFPTSLVQGGGGTSTNMNLNEVIASRAAQLLGSVKEPGNEVIVHPNDHVNHSQSTNDTYPTAMAMALYEMAQSAGEALQALEDTLIAKAGQFENLQRLGRTCLQDAVPLSVGQTHRAQAAALSRHRKDLQSAVQQLTAVPLGATAVGTGIGAPHEYAARAVGHLRRLTGRDYSVAEDFFDDLAHLDPYLTLAAAIVRPAITMAKIAADLRLLSSGPVGGLGEVNLPARQAGSSIMPGKVNPVIPELVMQLSYRIRGAANTVEMAVAAGELELNIMEPIVLDALVGALTDLTTSATIFTDKCISGMTWNEDSVRRNLAGSLQSLVEDATTQGYQQTAQNAATTRAQAGAAEGTS